MALPRPVLLALVGLVLIGGAFVMTRARSGVEESPPPPPPAPARPAPAAPEASTPQERPATTATVKSGRFAFRLALLGLADRGGAVKQRVTIGATGRFQSTGATAMPRFDIDFAVDDGRRKLRAGAISLGDRGYLTSGERAYPLPAAAWTQVVGARRRLAAFSEGSPPQETTALLGFDSETWFRDLRRAGSTRIDGVPSARLAGAVDVGKMLDDLRGSGTGVVGLDAKALAELEEGARKPRVVMYVGERDGILRRLRIRAAVEDRNARGARFGDYKHGRVVIAYRLTQANKPQRIAAPGSVTGAPVSRLGRPATVFASGALAVGTVAIDQPGLAAARRAGFRFDAPDPAGPAPSAEGAPAPSEGAPQRAPQGPVEGVPRPVARALQSRKVVVLFFRQSGSADDRAVAMAVARLPRGRRIAVFSASIKRLGDYAGIVAELNISRAPVVVIVGRDRRARVVEGYVDAETLAQEVRDTR